MSINHNHVHLTKTPAFSSTGKNIQDFKHLNPSENTEPRMYK